MEGTLLGVPSVAVSLIGREGFRFETAARFALRLARWVVERGLPPDTLLNVNVPAAGEGRTIRGFALTRMGRRRYGDAIVEKVDPRGKKYYWIGGEELEFELVEGTAGLGDHERRTDRRQQRRPVVEVVWRVGEHDVDVEGAGVAHRVAGDDTAARAEAEPLDVAAQRAQDVPIALDERAVIGPARQGLDPERSGSGEQVGNPGVAHEVAADQRVEDGLAHLVGGRPRVEPRR